MNRNDQEFIAQKIRTQYTEKEHTELDELRELDRKVKKPANVFAWVFGGIAALIMGSGMSLTMTNIGDIIGVSDYAMPIGIAIGVIGLFMAVINYPLYNRLLSSRRRKYSGKIMELSDKIINK